MDSILQKVNTGVLFNSVESEIEITVFVVQVSRVNFDSSHFTLEFTRSLFIQLIAVLVSFPLPFFIKSRSLLSAAYHVVILSEKN